MKVFVVKIACMHGTNELSHRPKMSLRETTSGSFCLVAGRSLGIAYFGENLVNYRFSSTRLPERERDQVATPG